MRVNHRQIVTDFAIVNRLSEQIISQSLKVQGIFTNINIGQRYLGLISAKQIAVQEYEQQHAFFDISRNASVFFI